MDPIAVVDNEREVFDMAGILRKLASKIKKEQSGGPAKTLPAGPGRRKGKPAARTMPYIRPSKKKDDEPRLKKLRFGHNPGGY